MTIEAVSIGRYPAEVEAAVYFCVLEALQNIAKYANASAGKVRLWVQGDELGFSVTDDGAGFDPATTRLGSGLQNMSDRLAALDGSLEIRSRPGDGTTVSAGSRCSPASPSTHLADRASAHPLDRRLVVRRAALAPRPHSLFLRCREWVVRKSRQHRRIARLAPSQVASSVCS